MLGFEDTALSLSCEPDDRITPSTSCGASPPDPAAGAPPTRRSDEATGGVLAACRVATSRLRSWVFPWRWQCEYTRGDGDERSEWSDRANPRPPPDTS